MNPDAFDSYPEMLNAEQLAKMLGISRAGAYQLLNCTGNAEHFPCRRISAAELRLLSYTPYRQA